MSEGDIVARLPRLAPLNVGPQAVASDSGKVVISPEAPIERDSRGRHSSASGELHAVLHTCKYIQKERKIIGVSEKREDECKIS